MLGMAESRITIEVPSGVKMEALKNFTLFVEELEETVLRGDAAREEQIITDVWVGIVLTLLVVCCAAFMCSCFLYHRFQIWKRRVLRGQTARNASRADGGEGESLPSYTVVSGLPSYSEALEQLKVVKQTMTCPKVAVPENQTTWIPKTPPTPVLSKLSVQELFQIYKDAQHIPQQISPATAQSSLPETNQVGGVVHPQVDESTDNKIT